MKDFERNEEKERLLELPTRYQKTISALILVFVLSTFYIVLRSILFTSTAFAIAQAPAIAYFTIQTNILICIWLGAIIVNIITGTKKMCFALNINLAAALTTYSAVNASIFWFVLVPIFSLSNGMPLFTPQNIWLHTITPVIAAVMLNYIIIENKTSKFKSKLILSMIYPVLYIILIVAIAIDGTYLYPMLNPTLVGGWVGVGVCMAATIIFVAIIYLAIIQIIKNNLE